MEENEIIHRLCGPRPCWIGFNDIKVEKTWEWSDGTPADFSQFPGGEAPWNPGEPNGHSFGDYDEKTDGAYM